MKKSLIALAVLAASGASFAQVSITGNLTAGFQSSNVPIGASVNGGITTADQSTSGFGVDTAEVVFSAKEDLGGGMKATAKLGLVDAARGMTAGRPNTGFGPGDAELGLSGGFGQLTLSSSRSTDYLSGGVAGVGGTFMDGRVFFNRVSRDSVAYSMPIGPVTVGLTYSEAANRLGLGDGTSGATTSSPVFEVFPARQVALAVQYADGPLTADVGYLSNDKLSSFTWNDTTVTPNVTRAVLDFENKNHLRGSVSYDLGVVKLGGGMERQSWEYTGTIRTKLTVTDTMLAVSAPLGAVTLGANWAQREISESTTATGNGSYNGYGLKAAYALSKRTAVSADYTNWNGAVNAQKQSQYNLFLSHSF